MNATFVRACYALLLASLCIALFGQTVSIEPETDRMGGDYKGFPVERADPVACQRACESDPVCKAFTYVKPGVKGPQAMCFLKSSVPRPTPDACCTSGARGSGGRPAPREQTRERSKPEPLPKPLRIVVDPALPADPEIQQIIRAPSTAEASEELLEHDVAWSWNAVGCFPGAAGSKPKPCPFVKDIDGFKVYALEGGVRATVPPAQRYAALGKQTGKCYVVTAFRGELESPPSPVACIDAPKAPLYETSSAIATPANLRATQDAKVCAAATGGGLMGPICEAALKSNAQILLWDHPGSAIDGFRIYDAVKGLPYAIDTKPNAKLRMYAVQPALISVSDYCFTVRAFKGDTESPPSNAICLAPKGPAPAPVKPIVVLAPVSGISSHGIERLKNQNAGCPFAQNHIDFRTSGDLAAAFQVYWIRRDKNILCGDRSVTWQEASVLFPLSELPADFKKVELRFTANATVAKEGTEGGFLGTFGNKPTFNRNCVKSIHAYYNTLKENTWNADWIGDPSAYFSWLEEDLITTETTANTTHRYDITPLVKKSLAKGKKNLGFVWSVDRTMAADNDMCVAAFQDVALEVRQ